MNRKSKKNHKSGKRKGGNGGFSPPGLMQLNTKELKPFKPSPILSHKFRYKIPTLVTQQTVTAANIFAAMVLATGATNGRAVFQSMRIKHFLIVGSVAASFEDMNCRDANQQGVVDQWDASNNNGTTSVFWKPSKKSLSSDWFNFNTQSGSSGANLFLYSAPVNAIVELAVDAVLNGTSSSISGASYTMVGATAGFMYSMGLDGSPGSIFYSAIGMNNA